MTTKWHRKCEVANDKPGEKMLIMWPAQNRICALARSGFSARGAPGQAPTSLVVLIYLALPRMKKQIWDQNLSSPFKATKQSLNWSKIVQRTQSSTTHHVTSITVEGWGIEPMTGRLALLVNLVKKATSQMTKWLMLAADDTHMGTNEWIPQRVWAWVHNGPVLSKTSWCLLSSLEATALYALWSTSSTS